jgi:hypothetical protein
MANEVFLVYSIYIYIIIYIYISTLACSAMWGTIQWHCSWRCYILSINRNKKRIIVLICAAHCQHEDFLIILIIH